MNAARSSLFGPLLVGLFLLGCEKSQGSSGDAEKKPIPPGAPVQPSEQVDAARAEFTDAAPPRERKKYKHVLQTGDSMVGGGLCKALKPMFEAEGAKFHRDVIESGTVHEFAQNDHLPKLLKQTQADLVLLTIGANHVPHVLDFEKEMGRYVRLLAKRFEGVDCYWIAPPLWKKNKRWEEFNAWLGTQVSPCKYYDGSSLDIERKPDKIHPSDKGGEVWAEGFWKFYTGEGANLAP